MDKKGVVNRLMLEIFFLITAAAVGSIVLYFVFISTNDLSLQTKIYQEDLEQTLNKMQTSKAQKITVSYELPENIKFEEKKNKIFLSDGEIDFEVKYLKKDNSEIKFARNKNILILEKNEKIS